MHGGLGSDELFAGQRRGNDVAYRPAPSTRCADRRSPSEGRQDRRTPEWDGYPVAGRHVCSSVERLVGPGPGRSAEGPACPAPCRDDGPRHVATSSWPSIAIARARRSYYSALISPMSDATVGHGNTEFAAYKWITGSGPACSPVPAEQRNSQPAPGAAGSRGAPCQGRQAPKPLSIDHGVDGRGAEQALAKDVADLAQGYRLGPSE